MVPNVEPGLFAVKSGKNAFVEWQIQASRAGSTWYLFCGGSSSLQVNVVSNATTETAPTGSVGEFVKFCLKVLTILTGFAWYNMQPYHITAISLNMLTNAAAQTLVGPDVYVIFLLLFNLTHGH